MTRKLFAPTPDSFSVSTIDEEDVEAVVQKVDWQIEESKLDGYAHYMEKEIFEQLKSLENALRGRLDEETGTAKFGGLNLTAAEFRQVDRILFCACGTAWRACLVAEYLIERFSRIPVEGRVRLGVPLSQCSARQKYSHLRNQPIRRDYRHPRRPQRSSPQGIPYFGNY